MSLIRDIALEILARLIPLALFLIFWWFVAIRPMCNKERERHQNFIEQFNYDFDSLFEKANAQYPNFSTNKRPFTVGKCLVFVKPSGRNELIYRDNFFGDLKDEDIAYNRSELEYIIIKELDETYVGNYTNGDKATRLNMTVKILDPESLDIIASMYVRGGEPPNSVTVRYSGSSHHGSIGMSVKEAVERMAESSGEYIQETNIDD